MVGSKSTRVVNQQGTVRWVVNQQGDNVVGSKQQGAVCWVVNQQGDRASTVKRPLLSGAAMTFRKVNSVNRMFGNIVVQGRP